ncbi:uncharacterized protein NECHADRAFT_99035 [Fusarium vanettenii 77-13-4]|uniref:Uncharacterized protein n=7 Tax=Fusarium solani species complex TaxID=232080 RepID=C7YJH2_FUSV7|nr:uncharacterized protein NECHADRAFT_99035 [Fusarium vanettenii 77-13-4]EEU48278.1 hypothetical protein NECHADRAFT_99035 [Fusarium vanettenii 77-13-4]
MASSTETTCYYLVPNLQALDPSAREVDASAYTWVQPTIIEDEDLTFGGKALSTWYEEERRRLSSGSDEEERRGRERVRRNYSRSSKSHKKRVQRPRHLPPLAIPCFLHGSACQTDKASPSTIYLLHPTSQTSPSQRNDYRHSDSDIHPTRYTSNLFHLGTHMYNFPQTQPTSSLLLGLHQHQH